MDGQALKITENRSHQLATKENKLNNKSSTVHPRIAMLPQFLRANYLVHQIFGWASNSSPAFAIQLRPDFHQINYLPENDRIRFTIHPEARKEVLKRLLLLNHKIHEEEVKAGLWEKKKTTKKSKSSENGQELTLFDDSSENNNEGLKD